MGAERAAMTFQSRNRRPGAVSVKKSLGQWNGMESVVRWSLR